MDTLSGMTETTHRGLVVEDDADVIELLVQVLARKNIVAILAHTAETARAILSTVSDLQIVLLDLHLPEGGGLPLIEHIRENHPHLVPRSIIVTGFPMIARAFATEMPVVPKDELSDLRARIDEILARPVPLA